MKDPNFLLSMQPKMVKGIESDGEDDDEDTSDLDEKFDATFVEESFMANSSPDGFTMEHKIDRPQQRKRQANKTKTLHPEEMAL